MAPVICRRPVCVEHRNYLEGRGKANPYACSPLCEGVVSTAMQSNGKKKDQRNIYIPDEEWETVGRVAQARGMAKSQYIREAVREKLAKEGSLVGEVVAK